MLVSYILYLTLIRENIVLYVYVNKFYIQLSSVHVYITKNLELDGIGYEVTVNVVQ